MLDKQKNIILIFDDREIVSGDVRNLVGHRRYGEIVFKRKTLIQHFISAVPDWVSKSFIHLRGADDLPELRRILETSNESTSVCVVAGRAGFRQLQYLNQLMERMPYAEEDFIDRLYKPLILFLQNAHFLVENWSAFVVSPLHMWDRAWQGFQRVQSVEPSDLSNIRDFLSFTCDSTATRHFNEVQIDTFFYTKRSTDKRKMLAEYSFYNLAPESMRPWLIQPFDYQDEGGRASYKMMRYYLADAALQWVHGAFESDTFEPFVERILFFLASRPQQLRNKEDVALVAKRLFVDKVKERAEEFLSTERGLSINNLVKSATPHLDLNGQVERYLRLYHRFQKSFEQSYLVVGHGDPCFSNILYDQQRYLLKLIDPKGAVSQDEMWTHPLYDLCKISHSVMGDYDFINNGLYEVGFTEESALKLTINQGNMSSLKQLFLKSIANQGYSEKVMRLGEASLFLSMLPLHIDHPKKIMAFLVIAGKILDEIEYG